MFDQTVIFRADASLKLGFGHIMRCISIAHMIKLYFKIKFICTTISIELSNEIKNEQWDLILGDDDTIYSMINPSSIVVLDGYNFTLDHQKLVKEYGAGLVFIDDLCSGEFIADLIINHAPCIKPSDYNVDKNTRFALGHEYALLRPAFLKQAKNGREGNANKNVLICFGGSDPLNITAKVLNTLLGNSNFKKIIVITGSAYMFLDTLENMISDNSTIEHFHSVSQNNLVDIMLSCEFAIVPSSGLLFEVIACRNTVISGAYVENQRNIFEGFSKLKAIIPVDFFSDSSINSALMKARTDLNATVKGVIDGESGGRILEKFVEFTTI